MISLRELLKARDRNSGIDYYFLTNQLSHEYYENYIKELGVKELFVRFPKTMLSYGGALGKVGPQSIRVALDLLALNLRVAVALRNHRIDEILANEPRAGLTIGLASLLAGRRLVLYVRNSSDFDYGLYRPVYRIARKIICVSQGLYGMLDEKSKAKAIVVNEAIDLNKEITPQPKAAADPVTILNTANIMPYKNQITLVKAVDQLVQEGQDVRLFIVGEATEPQCHQQIVDYIEANNLGDRVILTGFQPDVDKYLAQCDIYVQPSHAEGLPRVILEAFRYSIPTVGSDIPGIRSIVKHEENGLIYDTDDPTDLAAKLRVLIENPSQRRAYGANGRTLIEEKYNLAKNVQSVEEELRN